MTTELRASGREGRDGTPAGDVEVAGREAEDAAAAGEAAREVSGALFVSFVIGPVAICLLLPFSALLGLDGSGVGLLAAAPAPALSQGLGGETDVMATYFSICSQVQVIDECRT